MLFEGNRTGADIFLRMIGGHFYVYFLCRPDAIIDNGVARDILKAGLASLQKAPDPRDEMFVLGNEQARAIVGLLGGCALEAHGVV